ncbi:S8 family peptidase [Chitinophagaceae bacterium LB-8]|uniref:S8 family peptidase n=1 Tax=Paraflavisolibacter caeni TaxID=2982496 RepID=A0A9X3BIP0_9BACT|nr:S8 family serine peptidase [Paraflavisolibacter caeni]MCU7550238.1 S8 family peptidase [Paraflavisolibacter caeni]
MHVLKFGLLLIFFLSANLASGQKYLVRFTNKDNSRFTLSNPSAFLSQRAIDRRKRYAIALDSTDLPISPAYIDSLRSVQGITILNASKWLNQVSIQIPNISALNRISLFPFVASSSLIASRLLQNHDTGIALLGKKSSKRNRLKPLKESKITYNYFDYGRAYNQVHIHNGEFLHNIGLRGHGMIIGMLDAGFQNYTLLNAFDSINANNQVLGTWDFVTNNATVEDDHEHGMECLSIIAGNIPGYFVGTAPKANFYLYRTENSITEFPIEEHDWVCGAEKIDSAGGDVISSSLGYFQFDNPQLNHTYADMNGNITIAARGADLAARKGILVVNAIGNEGNDRWKYLSTPADGDSVLAVGAVTTNEQPAVFSSYGPSSDGQIKPDVVAVGAGTWVQLPNNTLGTGNGTSFACPIIAGLATCLWQGFQEYNNMTIINALRQSGSMASNPDDRIGYGVPDVKKAVAILLKQFATATASFNNCRTTIKWKSKDVSAMKYAIERKTLNDSTFKIIAEFSGTGTVLSTRNYELTDILTRIDSGPIFYRIHQIIDTTSSSLLAVYLDTVSVNVQTSCDVLNQINVFPNPTPGKFTVQTAFDEAISNLKIVVFNAAGQTVFTRKETKPEGSFNYIIDAPQLANGKYFVSVYKDNDLLETKELIIAK